MFNSEKLKKFKKMSLLAKIAIAFVFIWSVFQLVIHVYPLVFVLNNSLKTSTEIYESSFALTKTFSFGNYITMLEKFQVKGGIFFEELLWNSLWQTTLYLFANIASSTLLAYMLAKYRFPGKGLLYGVLIFIQTIPIIGGGAANFKLLYGLGFINNPWIIWIYWGMGFDYSAFILYGTFKSLSNSYGEAAKIDGAGNFMVFFKIVLPMMFPSIIALLVTNFLTMWNNYTVSQVTLSKYPNLAYGLFVFQTNSLHIQEGDTIFYTALVAAALPGVILYLSMQNLVVKNLTVGGLKG